MLKLCCLCEPSIFEAPETRDFDTLHPDCQNIWTTSTQLANSILLQSDDIEVCKTGNNYMIATVWVGKVML